jgi:hypothetical protein
MEALRRTELINIKIALCRNKYRIANISYLYPVPRNITEDAREICDKAILRRAIIRSVQR